MSSKVLSAALKIVQNGALLAERCSFKVGSSGWAAEAAAGKKVCVVCVCFVVVVVEIITCTLVQQGAF